MVTSAVTPASSTDLDFSGDPAEKVAQADMYFQAASAILSSLGGYDSPQLWAVQAFALMCTFALSVARRNVAYTHLGKSALPKMANEFTTDRCRNGCKRLLFFGNAQSQRFHGSHRAARS